MRELQHLTLDRAGCPASSKGAFVDLVTMVHPRLGERQVRREVVRRMRQNKWSVKGETAEAAPKGKNSKGSD